ncbi:MAG: hypothetical protein OEZ14_00565 [Acidimicrobiia bacterium]|nr:hypothetical protein [Acidimicrobiia bacterium]
MVLDVETVLEGAVDEVGPTVVFVVEEETEVDVVVVEATVSAAVVGVLVGEIVADRSVVDSSG